MANRTLYDVLNVKANCSSTDIANAWFRKKTLLASSSSEYLEAEKAYYALSDPVKRVMYDKFQIIEDDSTTFPCDNLFQFSKDILKSSCVKQYKTWMFPKPEITQTIPVSLEDLYNGRLAKVSVELTKQCGKCQGTSSYIPCANCMNAFQTKTNCPACKGTRFLKVPSNCLLCKGTGSLYERIETEVEIKRGMRDNQSIDKVLTSKVFSSNIKAEFVLKQKSHTLYSRQCHDLHMIKTITLTEALCGFCCIITQLDQRQFAISSGEGIVLYPGCKQVVKGEGMPIFNNKDKEQGDLIIHFQVEIPDEIERDVAKAIELYLPKRPKFSMPTNPETEEYHLLPYDPSYKIQSVSRDREAYHDERYDKKKQFEPKQQCTHQ